MASRTGTEQAEIARRKRERKLRRLEIPGTLDHAFRSVGGRDAAVAMARLASYRDPEIKELLHLFDELAPNDQLTPRLLENLALQVGLHPAEFFGRVSAAAYKHNFDVAQLTAAMKVTEIIERRAEFAMDKDGYKDAELVLKAGGHLQTGPLVQVNQNQTNQTLNVAAGLPPVEEITGRVSELIRGGEDRRLLTEGEEQESYIDIDDKGFEVIEKNDQKAQPSA